MFRSFSICLLATALTACSTETTGTNPFMTADTESVTDDVTAEDTGTPSTGTVDENDYENQTTEENIGIATDGLSPPEIATIDVNSAAIFRAQGQPSSYDYRSDSDLIYINNLPYDGLKSDPYVRYDVIQTADNFGVYRSINSVEDGTNGATIPQDAYRAIYGSSPSGGSQLAVVKTGAYQDAGFGGYIYQRQSSDSAGNDMSFVMPTNGQAILTGGYQGLIVYEPDMASLDHVKGNAELTIDFDDFETSPALWLVITDRIVYNDDGVDSSDQFTTISVENADGSSSQYHVDVLSVVEEKSLTTSGEFSGALTLDENSGSGNYYGILSGSNANEAVGIVELQWKHPQASSTTVRETGGFIVTRQ